MIKKCTKCGNVFEVGAKSLGLSCPKCSCKNLEAIIIDTVEGDDDNDLNFVDGFGDDDCMRFD